MGKMDTWRVTETGTVGEWFRAPNGDYVGTIISDCGDVYIAGSKDCPNPADGALITKGTRVRFVPEMKGNKVNDMETGAPYSWGVAREITILP